jgi:hypothetical protein
LAESAATGRCGNVVDAKPTNGKGSHVSSGFVLKRPEFRVTSSQTYWKPFFVPLDTPVVIRAFGEIASGPTAPRTGPDGSPLPEPLAEDGLGMHGLYEPSLPYHALIGRLCGENSCSRPFLVGRQRTVCPNEQYDHHIELWLNRVMTPPGMLDAQMPMTYKMFDLQARSGEYEFEVAGASPTACTAR